MRRPPEELAQRLDDAGEVMLAQLLRAYSAAGDHAVAADWWAPGAKCWVGMCPPMPSVKGQLWFDPLEVSCALLIPWPVDPAFSPEEQARVPAFHHWLSLRPVSDWQMAGASAVTAELPDGLGAVSGEMAHRYAVLFGKHVAQLLDWQFVAEGNPIDLVTRLWGSHPTEMGESSAWEGEVEIFGLDEVLACDREMEPGRASDMHPLALPFRLLTSIQFGLYDSDQTLQRRRATS